MGMGLGYQRRRRITTHGRDAKVPTTLKIWVGIPCVVEVEQFCILRRIIYIRVWGSVQEDGVVDTLFPLEPICTIDSLSR